MSTGSVLSRVESDDMVRVRALLTTSTYERISRKESLKLVRYHLFENELDHQG